MTVETLTITLNLNELNRHTYHASIAFLRDREWWLMKNDKAFGQITDKMEPTMQLRY
jgi:hypothetical protein